VGVIVTVTLNAALDVAYEAERVGWDATNQVSSVRQTAGGRGVAVARVLHTFGHEVVAAGLAGGTAGELIRTDLARSGVPTEFTWIGRESRRILEVTDTAAGRTMRFREPGPYITTEELGRFAADYRRLLADATAVVLSGSLPAGLPPEIYGSLATWAAESGVPAILDAGGGALLHGVSRHPALVIPDSADESASGAGGAERAGGTGRSADRIGAHELIGMGACAVAVLSGQAVRAVTASGEWQARLDPAAGIPGSRGALVAGLVPGVLLGWSWPDRLRHAVALSAAASPSGEIDLTSYERLIPEVQIAPP
jgi:tagatose 6-phosphate kinase